MDSCYLEAKDDGPNEAQCQPVVSIHNVMGSHVLQVNPLLLQELQSFVYILQTVDPHPAFGGLWLDRQGQRHNRVTFKIKHRMNSFSSKR